MTNTEIMAKAEAILKAPFPADKVQWRVGNMNKDRSEGSLLAYIDWPTAKSRLDELSKVGVTYKVEFPRDNEQGVFCAITLVLPDGTEIPRWNGAGWTDTEPFKGGVSGALKRAASMFGVGTYLYEIASPWVKLSNKRFFGKIVLPDEFLPESERTGNDKLTVEYDEKRYSNSNSNCAPKDIPENVQAAMNFVSATDGFNQGKKIGDIKSEKALFWLTKNGETEEERNAAQTVLDFRKK